VPIIGPKQSHAPERCLVRIDEALHAEWRRVCALDGNVDARVEQVVARHVTTLRQPRSAGGKPRPGRTGGDQSSRVVHAAGSRGCPADHCRGAETLWSGRHAELNASVVILEEPSGRLRRLGIGVSGKTEMGDPNKLTTVRIANIGSHQAPNNWCFRLTRSETTCCGCMGRR
jgi:hypothetical protein